jgi:hypothetical protein
MHAIDDGCTATELQKLTFLYSDKNKIEYYDFVPYTGFSATALFDYSSSDFSSIEKLRGNRPMSTG